MGPGTLSILKGLERAIDDLIAAAETSLIVAPAGFTPDDHAKFFHLPPRETLRTSIRIGLPCRSSF